jgi:predicted nucleotidyltransferase
MPTDNIEMLQTVADGLKELKSDIVFVGGAVAELYADDPASSDIRPTQDVDCTIELSSYKEHTELEEDLRAKGFANDTSRGAPRCRWIYQKIKVDVMPTGEKVHGFDNRWYQGGVENKISKTLPDGTEINVFPPSYYLASKFEAHNDRGGNDLRQSHDFEDIIYILDNCTSILEDIRNANEYVKNYLKSQCERLFANDGLSEGIESALPYGSDSDRVEIIEGLILEIASLD